MAKDLSRRPEVLQKIGYEFEPYAGGVNPFAYWDPPIPGVHCPLCFSQLDYKAVSSHVAVRSVSGVVYAEGHIIADVRFREFCIDEGYDDLEFLPINGGKALFELRPTRILNVDLVRSEPILGEICIRCGNFAMCLLGRGLFLRDVTKPLEDGFYRTDLVYGNRSGKAPIVCVGMETARKITAAGFKRIYFRPFPTIDEDFESRRDENLAAINRELQRLKKGRSWRRIDENLAFLK